MGKTLPELDPTTTTTFADQLAVDQGGPELKRIQWAKALLSLMGRIDMVAIGAVPNGITAVDASFATALAAVDMAGEGGGACHAGARIYFPPGKYKFNAPLPLDKTVILEGDSGHADGAQASRLFFPADTVGIEVHPLSASPLTSGGDGSIIQNLGLYGGGGTSTTAHGVWVRAKVAIRDCLIVGFSGNAINIVCSVGAGGTLRGAANGWEVRNVQAYRCLGGLVTGGTDSNAGNSYGFQADSCQRFGIDDQSGLGNTHHGPRAASCGLGGMVSYAGGLYYSLIEGNVGNQPDTSPAAWSRKDSMASGLCPAWDVAKTYNRGGAYRAIGGVSQTQFVGAYAESDQAPCVGGPAAYWNGGILACDFSTDNVGAWLRPNADGLTVTGKDFGYTGRTAAGHDLKAVFGSNGQVASGDILLFQHSNHASAGWTLRFWTADAMRFDYAHTDGFVPFYITNPGTTWQFGRGVNQPYKMWFPGDGIVLGPDEGNSRHLTYAAVMPTSGTYAKGDTVLNNNPTVTGAASSQYTVTGWKRMVTGSAHVLNTDWVEMRALTGT